MPTQQKPLGYCQSGRIAQSSTQSTGALADSTASSSELYIQISANRADELQARVPTLFTNLQ